MIVPRFDGLARRRKNASRCAHQNEQRSLLSVASTRGQQAEANFYEGARLWRANDEAGARARFAAVLATQMVGHFEYAMAQELSR